MFIIDFRNKLVSDYRFSVIGNSNVDKVDLVSHFIQYASGYSIYLKVRSDDERYVDKIAIASENVEVDEDVLVCHWTMGAVSTQCKKLYLQLQFEKDENIIAQSRIVSVVLGDTINVDELIPVIYPQVLKELQDQINVLKGESVKVINYEWLLDDNLLALSLGNKDGDTLASVQIDFPQFALKNEIAKLQATTTMIINPLTNINNRVLSAYESEYHQDFSGVYYITKGGNVLTRTEAEDYMEFMSGSRYLPTYDYEKPKNCLWIGADGNILKPQYDNETGIRLYVVKPPYVVKSSAYSVVYGTNSNGTQITIPYENIENSLGLVSRDSNGQINVPLAPTDNAHATSKKYVDDLAKTIKEAHYQVVDTTEYPTLNDFLASTGEEGYVYLYPIDTSDLTKGYYRYVWESNAWLALGTTEIDLTNYPTKNGNETISGTWTFSNGFKTEYIKDTSGNNRIRVGVGEVYCYANYLPDSNNTRDLGSSTYTWKDLYLAGKAYIGNATIESSGSVVNIRNGSTLICDIYTTDTYWRTDFKPAITNSKDLGSSNNKWKDLYVAGTLYGANYNITIDYLCNISYGGIRINNDLTELYAEKINVCSKSANTTFTLATAPANCYPEYKAIITNSGSSAITLTFTGVSTFLTNDEDNVIITNGTNTTISLSAGVSIEVSILNSHGIAINHNV